jgi:hydroxymethylglutaryl-CoA reductase (NADPH)
MPENYRRGSELISRMLAAHTVEELGRKLSPKTGDLPPRVRNSGRVDPQWIDRRWELLPAGEEARKALVDEQTLAGVDRYLHNIENFIGTVKVPVGIAGPIRVNGVYAQGDYYIPLATTEAALVASYSRGAQLISEAGGCTAVLLDQGVTRAPGFAFTNVRDCGLFVMWALAEIDAFRAAAEQTTRHGRLIDLRFVIEGNHVYLIFEYETGDASGQNMVTIATQAVCEYIVANSPVQPRHMFLEANMSGDKKASAISFTNVRGRKVTAEVIIPAELVRQYLHTTPEKLAQYGIMAGLGGVMMGSMGVQGHYANGFAALYIACGQDPACVAESAVGVTRWEVTEAGELYASVTLPNIMVGTVGGGTGLPSQRACLDILGLAGAGKADALAEVMAAVCLAGELSIAGALCANQFANAHRRLARGPATATARDGAGS